jgi:hypothetical protein
LDDIKGIWDAFGSNHQNNRDVPIYLKTVRRNIEQWVSSYTGAQFQMILLANIMNEIPGSKKAESMQSQAMLHSLIKRLLDPLYGVVLIIEPGQQDSARTLETIRSDLLEETTTIAPCLHDHECPLLSRGSRDWCYSERFWQPPAIIEQLDRITGLDHHMLRWSYWMFGAKRSLKIEEYCCAARKIPRIARLASGMIPDHGRTKVLLCRPDQLSECYLPSNDKASIHKRALIFSGQAFARQQSQQKDANQTGEPACRGMFWQERLEQK